MTTYLMVQHRVRDYAEWKRGYDAHRDARDHAGLVELHLLRQVADHTEVVLLFETMNLGRATAFVESANLRTAMEKVGVLGRPRMAFLESQ